MNPKIILYLVSFATFLGPFTQTIYTPIIPEIQADFRSSQLLISFSISIFTIALAVMQLVYGPLVDRYGKRKILLPGLGLYMVASLLGSFVNSIEQLLLLRVLQGIGIASCSVVATTVIADLFQGKWRGQAMGQFQMFVALGPVVGPVVGGYVGGYFGFHGVFWVLAAAGFIMLILNGKLLPETAMASQSSASSSVTSYKRVLMHPIGAAILVLGFIQYYVYYHYLVFLPEVLSLYYGLTAQQKGLFFLALSVMMMVGSFLGGRVLLSIPEGTRIIVFSILLSFCTFSFVFIAEISIVAIAINIAAFGLFFGLSLPVQTTWLTECFTQQRATAAGIYNFSRYMGMAAGPLLGSILYKEGHLPLLFGSATVAILCMSVFIRRQFIRYQFIQSKDISQTQAG
ncbi:MFS transporter [Ammoniphilus sp. YIM 78166]|uniref:MFS transporter n=1 Tax=Ammoniphilus sp. YIM 78166 TaxID=1644106 RepID=UPI00106F3F91|nr:MFS transporter [Ammoniphilus sp. YIM 78166]